MKDLDRLPPDDVARICEWITEQLDDFSAKLKPEETDAELEVRVLRSSGIWNLMLYSISDSNNAVGHAFAAAASSNDSGSETYTQVGHAMLLPSTTTHTA